uniref:Ion transport domain-containing protein n=1 Tax=Alexandrium monilatum TaxID=311494 RepID=A0A7S4UW65_9DINO
MILAKSGVTFRETSPNSGVSSCVVDDEGESSDDVEPVEPEPDLIVSDCLPGHIQDTAADIILARKRPVASVKSAGLRDRHEEPRKSRESTGWVPLEWRRMSLIRRRSSKEPPPRMAKEAEPTAAKADAPNGRRAPQAWVSQVPNSRLAWRPEASSTRSDVRTGRDPWVLSPQSHPLLQYWDLGTMIALAFVAIVTPAEVALLETRLDPLFLINRVVDSVFVFDMALQFCVAYHVKTPYGTRLETRRKIIVRHYLRTWFALDVISVLPFDSVGMLFSSGFLERAKMMKVLRLLRLIKLVRVLRASRVFHRWETSMAVNYNRLKLVSAFLVFLLASHWLACVWAMLGFQDEEDQRTWVDHAAPGVGGALSHPAEVYIAALYWSSMTVTSVGYGDIVPVTTLERVVCILLMFCAGFLWAYVLGEVMSSLGNSNVHEKAFRQMLDDLNHMMADRGLPRHLQRRLRGFFFQIKDLARVEGYKAIVDQLSPSLQGELAMTVNEVWLRKVWYFNCKSLPMQADFMSALATQLEVCMHAQQECVGEAWNLYILHRGLAIRQKGLLQAGAVWGEDFILACQALLENAQAVCLTFIELSQLSRKKFVEVVRRYPQVWKPIRGAVVRMAARRGILQEAAWRREYEVARNGSASLASGKSFALVNLRPVGTDFPLPAVMEDSAEVSVALQEVAAKQARMQEELDATRNALGEQLSRIEAQLRVLLPRSRSDGRDWM